MALKKSVKIKFYSQTAMISWQAVSDTVVLQRSIQFSFML